MSRYISLDAHTQLEQTIIEDLKSALNKRGFSVIHNGAWNSHAPGGKADIVAFNDNYVLIFEVTKSKSAGQDREFQPIRSHLKEIKVKNPEKQCFCVFVSPKTSERIFDSIHDHNHQRASEGKMDMKILPLAFKAFELWVTRLKEYPENQYPMADFLGMFEQYRQFTDDARLFNLLIECVFPNDGEIYETPIRAGNINHADHLDNLCKVISQHKSNLSEIDIKLGSVVDIFTDTAMRDWGKIARSKNLSMAQVYVLQELYYQEPCNIALVSERLKITAAATSQLIDTLVRSGLVNRTEYPENRRMKQLTLTSQGTAFIEEGNQRQYNRMEEILHNMNEEEREQVLDMFDILAKYT